MHGRLLGRTIALFAMQQRWRHEEREEPGPWNAIKGPQLGPFNETLITKGQPLWVI